MKTIFTVNLMEKVVGFMVIMDGVANGVANGLENVMASGIIIGKGGLLLVG